MSTRPVILVNTGVFQEYINDNIRNLLLYGNKVILIIDDNLIENIDTRENIQIIKTEELDIKYFEKKNRLNSTFRHGFWKNCSKRLFCVYEAMKKYDLKECFHIENDVILMGNTEEIIIKEEKIFLTMDSEKRCIPGIVYIPSHAHMEKFINGFNFRKNDMENLAIFSIKNKNICETFPIINKNKFYDSETIYNKNFIQMQMIFDAAAIGQYLGGVDPRNIPGNTVGFINETCVINYSKFSFTWEILEGKKFLFLFDGDNKIRVFNIHIHCKNLKKFTDN